MLTLPGFELSLSEEGELGHKSSWKRKQSLDFALLLAIKVRCRLRFNEGNAYFVGIFYVWRVNLGVLGWKQRQKCKKMSWGRCNMVFFIELGAGLTFRWFWWKKHQKSRKMTKKVEKCLKKGGSTVGLVWGPRWISMGTPVGSPY